MLSHSLESSNDLHGLYVEARKCRDYFETLSGSSLAELYAKNNLTVILKLGSKSDVLSKGIGASNVYIEHIDRPIFVLQFNALDSSNSNHGDEDLVSIVNVESVDGADIVVPSLVRFNAIDHEIEQVGSRVYLSCFRKIAYKFGFRNGDGKVRPPIDGLGVNLSIVPRQAKSRAVLKLWIASPVISARSTPNSLSVK